MSDLDRLSALARVSPYLRAAAARERRREQRAVEEALHGDEWDRMGLDLTDEQKAELSGLISPDLLARLLNSTRD